MLLTTIGILVSVETIALIAMRFAYTWELSRNPLAFKDVFGFEPPSPEDGLAAIEKAQEKVDEKLKDLAEPYAEADLHERKVAKAVKDAQSPLKAKALKIYLGLARQALKKAKAEFWHAHGLAKHFGFHVHEKYTDYRPPELREKVLGPPQIGGRPGPPDSIPDTEAWWEREGVHGWR